MVFLESTIRPQEFPLVFGEVPEGSVSVFLQVRATDLPAIQEQGLCIDQNKMSERQPALEEIFEAARGTTRPSRTNAIFAYLEHPQNMKSKLSTKPDKVILEAKIDPINARVADAEHYTEAYQDMTGIGGTESAKEWAQQYWKGSRLLEQYNQETDGFSFPEVLIAKDIPTNQLRIVNPDTVQKSN